MDLSWLLFASHMNATAPVNTQKVLNQLYVQPIVVALNHESGSDPYRINIDSIKPLSTVLNEIWSKCEDLKRQWVLENSYDRCVVTQYQWQWYKLLLDPESGFITIYGPTGKAYKKSFPYTHNFTELTKVFDHKEDYKRFNLDSNSISLLSGFLEYALGN